MCIHIFKSMVLCQGFCNFCSVGDSHLLVELVRVILSQSLFYLVGQRFLTFSSPSGGQRKPQNSIWNLVSMCEGRRWMAMQLPQRSQPVPLGVVKLGWSSGIPQGPAVLIKEVGPRLLPGRGQNLLPRAISGEGLKCELGNECLGPERGIWEHTPTSTTIVTVAIGH